MLDRAEGSNVATPRIAETMPAAALLIVDAVEVSKAGGGGSAIGELIEDVTAPNCVVFDKVVLESAEKPTLEEEVETIEVRLLKEPVGEDNRSDCEVPNRLPRLPAAAVTVED